MTERHYYFSTTSLKEAGQPDSLATSGTARFFAILTLSIALGGLFGSVLFSGKPLIHDAGLLLDCARLILHGWVPYVDFAEINPPMTHYIHVLPVYLASLLNLEIPTAFFLFVMVLAVYSAAALLFLLSRLTPIFSLPSRLVLAAVCVMFSLWALRANDFGQRDHLFALAFIPWPMFLLKPHFCVLIALVEAWFLFLGHRFSTLRYPEILVLAGWVVAYAVHFCFWPSEMRDALFFRWLPSVIASYDAYNTPLRDIAAQFSPRFWLLQIPAVLAVLVLFAKQRLPNNWRLQLHGLVASTILAWGIVVAQHKGWSYHLLPAIYPEMLLAATLVIMVLERASVVNFLSNVGPAIRKAMFLLVCLCLSLLSITMSYSVFESAKLPHSTDDLVRVIKQQVPPDEKVAFISTSVSAYPTLIYAKRLPGTRFLHAFQIAYLYKGVRSGKDGSFPYRSPSEATPEERRFLSELGSDILKHRPKLVFIEAADNCQGCPKDFRVEEYLMAAGWLESFMKNYRLAESLHEFSVYVRVD
jgi:hypothetical protein